jgi:hypothetical protein
LGRFHLRLLRLHFSVGLLACLGLELLLERSASLFTEHGQFIIV